MKLFKRKKKKKMPRNEKYKNRVEVVDGKINRRFSPTWQIKGNFKEDEIILYLQGLKSQRKVMIEYIDELHDYVDNLLINN